MAENTLKFNIESVEAFVAFVEQFKCSVDNPDVGCLIKLQIHKHSRTFRKREVKICRFSYPFPPYSKTLILEQLETEKVYKLYQILQKNEC